MKRQHWKHCWTMYHQEQCSGSLVYVKVLDIVKNVIQDEIKQLCKNDCEIFKGNGSNNEKWYILTWNTQVSNSNLRHHSFIKYSAVLFWKNLPQMLSAIAVLLYGRSQTTNRLQYILGLTIILLSRFPVAVE